GGAEAVGHRRRRQRGGQPLADRNALPAQLAVERVDLLVGVGGARQQEEGEQKHPRFLLEISRRAAVRGRPSAPAAAPRAAPPPPDGTRGGRAARAGPRAAPGPSPAGCARPRTPSPTRPTGR